MHSFQRGFRRLAAPIAAVTVLGGLLISSQVGAVAAGSSTAGNTGTVTTVPLAGTTTLPANAAGVGDLNRDPRSLPAWRQLNQRDAGNSARPAANKVYAATGLRPPVVPATPISGNKPGLKQTFRGINVGQMANATGFSVTPPDQALCVGNGYVVEAVNVAMRVYKTSGATAGPTTDLTKLYGYPPYYNPKTKRYGPFLTDPVCLFDQATGRFFIVVLTLDVNPTTGSLTLRNHLDIAVSRTGNPLGAYSIYKIQATDTGGNNGPAHKSCPCIGDYPHIALDKYGLYITTNEYPWSSGPGKYGNNYNGAQLYAVSKTRLAQGASTVKVVHFQDTSLAGGSIPGFTLWPVNVPNSSYATGNNGTQYFVSSTAGEEARPKNYTGFGNSLGFFQLSNTKSLTTTSPNPYLTRNLLSSETYGIPPVSMQKVGPVPLRDCLAVGCLGVGIHPNEREGAIDSSDTRVLTGFYAGGRVFTALDTVMQVNGDIQAGVAWFSINPGTNAGAARIANQGYLGTGGNNVIYPSIATLDLGRGIMNFTLVGKNFYPSQAYIRWTPSGPQGSVAVAAQGAAPLDDFCEYLAFNCGGTDDAPAIRPRFGDYSAATTYANQIWIANETVNSSCTFAEFGKDQSCGGSRTFYANWATRISTVNP